MSSKRVWAVRGQYRTASSVNAGRWLSASFPIEHETIALALEDVEYLWDSGFGSSMRSYVVPA